CKPSGGFQPGALVAGAFNGDGRTDLAVAAALSNPYVQLEVQTTQGFLEKFDSLSGRVVTALTTGDLNHDNIPDLVTLNSSNSNVSIWLGKGGGTFGALPDH